MKKHDHKYDGPCVHCSAKHLGGKVNRALSLLQQYGETPSEAEQRLALSPNDHLSELIVDAAEHDWIDRFIDYGSLIDRRPRFIKVNRIIRIRDRWIAHLVSEYDRLEIDARRRTLVIEFDPVVSLVHRVVH